MYRNDYKPSLIQLNLKHIVYTTFLQLHISRSFFVNFEYFVIFWLVSYKNMSSVKIKYKLKLTKDKIQKESKQQMNI